MRFVAIFRPTVSVTFDADVEELRAPPDVEDEKAHREWERHQQRVLKARAAAGKQAEAEAERLLKGLDVQALEMVEVREDPK